MKEKGASGLRMEWTLLILGVLALWSCGSSESDSRIQWQHYSSALLEQAGAEGRPVILNFHAEWCLPCHELDHFTFSDERVIESTTTFMMVKADLTDYDSPRSQRLREQFNVTGVPEVLFIGRDGNEIREVRVIGFVGPEDFLQRLKLVTSIL